MRDQARYELKESIVDELLEINIASSNQAICVKKFQVMMISCSRVEFRVGARFALILKRHSVQLDPKWLRSFSCLNFRLQENLEASRVQRQ
jgi:hypothetical protein